MVKSGFLFVGLILFLSACNSAQQDADGRAVSKGQSSADATRRYWTQLCDLEQKISKNKSSDRIASPEEAVTHIRASVTLIEGMVHDIEALPSFEVDADLIDYSSQLMISLRQLAAALSDLGKSIDESENLKQSSKSVGTVLEAVLRGAFGDPMGRANEFKVQSDELSKRQRDAADRLSQIGQRMLESDAKEYQLKATLSRRYGLDFQAIEKSQLVLQTNGNSQLVHGPRIDHLIEMGWITKVELDGKDIHLWIEPVFNSFAEASQSTYVEDVFESCSQLNPSKQAIEALVIHSASGEIVGKYSRQSGLKMRRQR